MASNKVRVAVIGVGNMGSHHVRNYAKLRNAELVGLADLNPASQQLAKQYGVPYFKDYQKMIDQLQPDAVSVVVPTPLHLEVGRYAMERGVHCLMEKPIAYAVREADELIGLAEKNQVVFTVGHIERYNPIIRAIKNIMDNKTLGKITSVVCQRVGGFPAIEPTTDVIIDLAVHDIDIINFLLGRQPDELHSHGSRTHHSKKIDSAEILLDYGNASGFIQANWLTPVKLRTISITGSNGYIEGNYITQQLIHHKHNMEVIKGFSNFVSSLGNAQKEVIPVKFEEPLAVELKAFLAAVLGRKNAASQLVNPWDAREALRLSLKAVEKYAQV